MDEKTVSQNTNKNLSTGMHTAIIGNTMVRDIQDEIAFAVNETERDKYADKLPIGSFVALYGMAHMWQLKPDRTWATVY